MRMADGTIRIHFVQAARATMLRAGCVFVLLLCVSGPDGRAGRAYLELTGYGRRLPF